MADMIQDLLSLQYSQNFEIQGIQEANFDLVLPPRPGGYCNGLWRCK